MTQSSVDSQQCVEHQPNCLHRCRISLWFRAPFEKTFQSPLAQWQNSRGPRGIFQNPRNTINCISRDRRRATLLVQRVDELVDDNINARGWGRGQLDKRGEPLNIIIGALVPRFGDVPNCCTSQETRICIVSCSCCTSSPDFLHLLSLPNYNACRESRSGHESGALH